MTDSERATIQAIAAALGCSPEIEETFAEGITLLGYRAQRNQPRNELQTFPLLVNFDNVTTGEEEASVVLSMKLNTMSSTQYQPAGQHVQQCSVMGATNCFLAGSGAQCRGVQYCNPGQEPTDGEAMGPGREPTTIVLLNGYCIKLYSKYLYPYIRADFSLGQRSSCNG